MLSRFDFKLESAQPFGFLFGAGADFFQQLKLDILDTLVKAFFKESFLQLLLAPICLFVFSFIK